MSGILFVVGAVAAVIGLAMVGFGIPVNEFSFGNTLIQAGVTSVVGGLIVVALGVVVAQLQRIAEALTAKSPIRSTRPLDMFDNARSGRVPFPPKPKAEVPAHEPFAPADHLDRAGDEDQTARSYAPSLRNPEESPVTVEDDVSLSPQHPAPRPAAEHDEDAARANLFDRPESDFTEPRQEPALDSGWRPAPRPAAGPAPTAFFDAMWPSATKEAREPKPAVARSPEDLKPFAPRPLFDHTPYAPKNLEPKPFATKPAEPRSFEPAPEPEPELPANEPAPPRAPVAILKSGVVDGMAYTLYVDGSIEAELPQGTLRFASINELRAHLEKNS